MAQSKFIQAVVKAAKGRPKSTAWYQDKIKEFVNHTFSSYKSGIIHPKIDKDWRKKVDQYFSYIMAKRLMYQHWFIDTPKKK